MKKNVHVAQQPHAKGCLHRPRHEASKHIARPTVRPRSGQQIASESSQLVKCSCSRIERRSCSLRCLCEAPCAAAKLRAEHLRTTKRAHCFLDVQGLPQSVALMPTGPAFACSCRHSTAEPLAHMSATDSSSKACIRAETSRHVHDSPHRWEIR